MTTEHGMCAALEAVYELAVNRMGVRPQNVLLWGKSLGSGPSVYMASEHRPMAGVVLVSPLASGARCVCGAGVPRALLGVADQLFMPSVERMARVRVPVCVVHGTRDDVVDVENAKALVARCGAGAAYTPLYVPAGHNDVETLHGARFVAHVTAFLEFASRVTALPYARDVNE